MPISDRCNVLFYTSFQLSPGLAYVHRRTLVTLDVVDISVFIFGSGTFTIETKLLLVLYEWKHDSI